MGTREYRFVWEIDRSALGRVTHINSQPQTDSAYKLILERARVRVNDKEEMDESCNSNEHAISVSIDSRMCFSDGAKIPGGEAKRDGRSGNEQEPDTTAQHGPVAADRGSHSGWLKADAQARGADAAVGEAADVGSGQRVAPPTTTCRPRGPRACQACRRRQETDTTA